MSLHPRQFNINKTKTMQQFMSTVNLTTFVVVLFLCTNNQHIFIFWETIWNTMEREKILYCPTTNTAMCYVTHRVHLVKNQKFNLNHYNFETKLDFDCTIIFVFCN